MGKSSSASFIAISGERHVGWADCFTDFESDAGSLDRCRSALLHRFQTSKTSPPSFLTVVGGTEAVSNRDVTIQTIDLLSPADALASFSVTARIPRPDRVFLGQSGHDVAVMIVRSGRTIIRRKVFDDDAYRHGETSEYTGIHMLASLAFRSGFVCAPISSEWRERIQVRESSR